MEHPRTEPRYNTRMLTRFKVSGFKNLVDVDVRFGPFTCIAGANGVGKSNLFDAIKFLGLTAKGTLKDAALAVRGGETGQGAIRNLFHRFGDTQNEKIIFAADFTPQSLVVDELGNENSSEYERLRYKIELMYKNDRNNSVLLANEELYGLESISLGDREHFFEKRLILPTFHNVPKNIYKIGNEIITLPHKSDKSVLSAMTVTLFGEKAIVVSRGELLSWRVLQIEPSSIRNPLSENNDVPRVLSDTGAHLAATLHRIAQDYRNEDGNPDPERIYAQATSRLHALIGGDVQSIRVDDDDKRELYTLYLTDRNGTEHPARSLSDGTLRFLALITLWLDPEATGVFCIEEPENGIHPARLPALVRLLQDIAVNPEYPTGPDNPLRQVIVVTHSPEFVKLVPEDSLLLARTRDAVTPEGVRYSRAEFVPLANTWRVTPEMLPTEVASRNELLAYLNPSVMSAYDDEDPDTKRVMDRPDLQSLLSLARE